MRLPLSEYALECRNAVPRHILYWNAKNPEEICVRGPADVGTRVSSRSNCWLKERMEAQANG